MSAVKRVYRFEEGNCDMGTLLGGKGANLAEMTRLGLPIPPGFTLTTEVCRAFHQAGGQLTDDIFAEICAALKVLETSKQTFFGDEDNPLLVSVRSGSVSSMPGMMDTILNLGLNDFTIQGLAKQTGNEGFAYDCYRRFIQMFGEIVLGIPALHFDKHLEQLKEQKGRENDQEVTAEEWKQLVLRYHWLVEEQSGKAFPQDVYVQLRMAVCAVLRSWNNTRAKVYRKLYQIPDEQGTAVNVQAMVFGNKGDNCGTGVLFTRNPSSGAKELYGEYLINAQGEDVVAGVRTPRSLSELGEEMPEVYAELSRVAGQLEQHYRDMQDVEFTVENGKLFLLQTRSGKRTAQAAVNIAVALVEEGLITKQEAVSRIEAGHLDQLLHRSIEGPEGLRVIAAGLPASPGAATGAVVLDADTAEEWAKAGTRTILVSSETSPEDIHGILAAEGVLTSRGGMTSHAAVVARGMGKPCICGCDGLAIDREQGTITLGEHTLRQGDVISLDGTSGQVYLGSVSLSDPVVSPGLLKLLQYADEFRELSIYTNADTPADAAKAREWGAEGIGLCRTEHMFFSDTRLPIVQAMILAETKEERIHQLGKILPMQQSDFEEMFRVMHGLPVTIRLLDPPLHEFLPNLEQIVEQYRAAVAEGSDKEEVQRLKRLMAKVRSLQESNPMLGLRGCRLGLMFPEIYDMQIEAIFRAAATVVRERLEVRPEIMIPLVGHPDELKAMRALVDEVASQVLSEEMKHFKYRVGTMIEVPRAAIVADAIAEHADFFSFGTNDLTQMTFGYSRDDAEGKFLNGYLEKRVLQDNPFQVLDEEGVGVLIQWAVDKGKARKFFLKTGLCGEHGGDMRSISFCQQIGLDYVSCSPYRIPYARISAAKAALIWPRRKQAFASLPEESPSL
ncbi:pyruvate, phosphate dikinase [Paenibacillus donghaensis]|uniref:Pyruvate, phosphate dikinase n=1 Tax=Paenibacillus donghaensis TaxID=414771 RepID=A0A2Z2KIV6_9BACL|nr:pyruvate, phosphate dikinase [Paenibacillus donghaensis]ASA20832.1 pyruvate, phosphate dikinase [Paenibacillus donghaensis]